MDQSRYVRVDTILDSVSAEDKAVRLAAFKAILANTLASIQLLSQRTGLAPSAVASALVRLEENGSVLSDDEGRIVGSRGLSLIPTNHQLRMSGNDYYTWCAEDAIGIPAALDADATITSTCFHCGQPVSVEMKRGEIAHASSPDIRLWIAEAQVGRSVVGFT